MTNSDGCTAGPLTDYLNTFACQCCKVHDSKWTDDATLVDLLKANVKWAGCVARTKPKWRGALWAVIGFLILSTVGIVRHRLIAAWRRRKAEKA
jgi:hypothetical protein